MLSALLALATLATGPGSVAAQPIQEQAQRPPPLTPQPGCEVWRGRNLEGNDATIVWELRLCPPGHALPSLFQTSSLVSGWSSRESRGAWDAASTLWQGGDTRFVENRPQPGWRFCLADRWQLRRTAPNRLAGEYWSTDCADHSRVDFELVGETAAGMASQPPRPIVPIPPPPPPSTRGTCGLSACAAAPRPSSGGPAPSLFLAALLALTVRRRRAPQP